MSKVFWVVVSDSGLIAISGGRKNRMKYEMDAEFQLKKPAHVEKLFYRPLWGKTRSNPYSIWTGKHTNPRGHRVETSWLGRMA